MLALQGQVEDLMRRTIDVLSREPRFTATDAREGLEDWHQLDPAVFLPRLREIADKKFPIDDIQLYIEARTKETHLGNRSGAVGRIHDAALAKSLGAEWMDLLHVAVVIARGVEGKESSFGTTTRDANPAADAAE